MGRKRRIRRERIGGKLVKPGKGWLAKMRKMIARISAHYLSGRCVYSPCPYCEPWRMN